MGLDARDASLRAGVLRTPEACFAQVPDVAWTPHYSVVDGMRIAHLDEGPADAPVVLLMAYRLSSVLPMYSVAPSAEIVGDAVKKPDPALNNSTAVSLSAGASVGRAAEAVPTCLLLPPTMAHWFLSAQITAQQAARVKQRAQPTQRREAISRHNNNPLGNYSLGTAGQSVAGNDSLRSTASCSQVHRPLADKPCASNGSQA